ncbi:MAG: MBL fold metallo-hydrolase [Desulfobacteraceae bacterium]|nr:MBL fold metallo-hydrolase [Desulfobacteraceae bacterium]
MTFQEQCYGPIRLIPGDNGGRYPSCHSILLEDAGILIDPASNRERLEELQAQGKIRMVWLSHWHEDHFRDLDLFDDRPLWMNPHDAPPLSDMEIFFEWYGLNGKAGRQLRLHWEPILKEQFHFRPRTPDGFLNDGDRINLGNLTVEVIHIPGHTPGHVAFYFREPEILFMGDCDLTAFGPWYGDRYSSIEQTINSVQRLRNIPARVYLAGHETGIFENPSQELWQNYLDVIQKRETALLNLLTKPKTMDEIVEAWIVYGKERQPREFYEFGERAHMEKHLERLMDSGVVTCDSGRYRRID